MRTNSVAQLKTWIEEETGEPVDTLNKAAVQDLIDETDCDRVQRVLEIRQELGKASVSKYTAMRNARSSQDRVRGLLQFYGAGTGRWAGRLVQVQNLPRNKISGAALSVARELVKAEDSQMIELIFGNVQDTLSQLIRTAFIPSPGNRFLIADFSAIEARVIAWLAGETWRQEVFETSGKIYEASAAQMFGVPVESIAPGRENYALRQKGKVAELALGYQGSVGALIQMGALDMGLNEDELPEIVELWRERSPRIVQLWYALQRAALNCIRTAMPQQTHSDLPHEASAADTYMTIELPSERKLFFAATSYRRKQVRARLDRVLQHESDDAQVGTMSDVWRQADGNVVQAIARLSCSHDAPSCGKGCQIVMHIHDEVVIDHRSIIRSSSKKYARHHGAADRMGPD